MGRPKKKFNRQAVSLRLLLGSVFTLAILATMELFALLIMPAPQWNHLYCAFQETRLFIPVSGLRQEDMKWKTNPLYGVSFHSQNFNRKSPDTFRIFTVGGSAMFGWGFGDPFHWNAAALLGKFLSTRFPGRRIEVINAAGLSWGSSRVAPLVHELVRYNPDLIIVYSGNNEFHEYGAYHDVVERPISIRKMIEIGERSRFFLVLQTILVDIQIRTGAKEDIGETCRDLDGKEYAHLREIYRCNLEDIIKTARTSGAKVLLTTIPVNLKANPDNRYDWLWDASHHGSNLDESGLARWNTAWKEGLLAMEKKEWVRGLACFSQARNIDPEYAETTHWQGACLENMGRYDQAYEKYWEYIDRVHRLSNRDLEADVRATALGMGASLFDARGLFEARSPHRLTNYTLFVDSMHPNKRGHALLAEGLAGPVTDIILRKYPSWASGAPAIR
jgi:hypothetical protein